MKRIILLSTVIILLGSCGYEPQTVASDQMVIETGREIASETFQTLSSQLRGAIEEGGIPHALQFCSVKAMPLTQELADRYNVTIRRATHRPRNQTNRADQEELDAIQAYIRAIEGGNELTPRLVRQDDYIRFFAPIQVGMDLCLQCHGTPNSDITKNNLEVIRSLYPEDEATGFSMRELRGIWSITLPADSVSIQNIRDHLE